MSANESEQTMTEEGSEERLSWIKWFNNKALCRFLVEVDYDYITDAFNLYGLKAEVPNFDELLDIITGDAPDENSKNIYDKEAIYLYSLIHARFIISPKGLSLMKDKYENGEFGKCPRMSCAQHNVLPIGLCDQIKMAKVHIYCPLCQEIYKIDESEKIYLDGSFFGTSFPHILLQTYPFFASLKTPSFSTSKIFGYAVRQNFSRTEYKIIRGEFGEQAKRKFLKNNPKYLNKLKKEELEGKDRKEITQN